MKISLKEQLLAAIFAAVIAVFSQITIPIGLVPFSLQTFIVGLIVALLNRKIGTIAIFIYILLGLIGFPVFAGGGSGIAALIGPTGGFLIGFLPMAWLIGTLLKKVPFTFFWTIAIELSGFLLVLLFGTFWLKLIGQLTWPQSFANGFYPFVLIECLKAISCGLIVIPIKNRLPQRILTMLG